jgi:PEP-CTERM motif
MNNLLLPISVVVALTVIQTQAATSITFTGELPGFFPIVDPSTIVREPSPELTSGPFTIHFTFPSLPSQYYRDQSNMWYENGNEVPGFQVVNINGQFTVNGNNLGSIINDATWMAYDNGYYGLAVGFHSLFQQSDTLYISLGTRNILFTGGLIPVISPLNIAPEYAGLTYNYFTSSDSSTDPLYDPQSNNNLTYTTLFRQIDNSFYTTTPVPEPSTYLAGLSALGMLGLFGWRSRK